jgi:hypothetical protein
MTNDECRMTKEIRMANSKRGGLYGEAVCHSGFVIPSSFVLRHFCRVNLLEG